MRHIYLSLIALIAATFASFAGSEDAVVDTAPDYRAWQHVKSMIIQPGHPLEDRFGGIHHVYANAKAMVGLANGEYAAGAVFVFDLLDYEISDMTIVETAHKRLDVMRYDPAKYALTGGWEYATYLPDNPTRRIEQDVVAACYSCHIGAKAAGYVFSHYRP